MATKKLTNEFMEKVLNDSAWKELSNDFQWTEQMLEKHKNNVDWKEISQNRNIVWTPAMLEKFKKQIDWKELSGISCETILTEECFEQFKDYWNWSELSDNENFSLTYELIDRFIDLWDWSSLKICFMTNLFDIFISMSKFGIRVYVTLWHNINY